jgi:hypothetical protein
MDGLIDELIGVGRGRSNRMESIESRLEFEIEKTAEEVLEILTTKRRNGCSFPFKFNTGY